MSLIVDLKGTVNLEDKQKGKSINRWRILKKAIRKEPNFSVKPAGWPCPLLMDSKLRYF